MRTIAQTGRAIQRFLNDSPSVAWHGMQKALDDLKVEGERKIREVIDTQKLDIEVGFDWDVYPVIRAVRENTF